MTNVGNGATAASMFGVGASFGGILDASMSAGGGSSKEMDGADEEDDDVDAFVLGVGCVAARDDDVVYLHLAGWMAGAKAVTSCPPPMT
eukprot:3319882-Ditylum_brightwellii.AAC.1